MVRVGFIDSIYYDEQCYDSEYNALLCTNQTLNFYFVTHFHKT